jgi:hypothetical protein
MTPSNPNSPRSKPRKIGADNVAGTYGSNASTTTCAVITIEAASLEIALANGTRSRVRSVVASAPMRGSAVCESTAVAPWPGKCLRAGFEREIGARCEIDADAQTRQISSDERPGRFAHRGVTCRCERHRRRQLRDERRIGDACDASAFLIDRNERRKRAARAQYANRVAQLRRAGDVAREENDRAGPKGAQIVERDGRGIGTRITNAEHAARERGDVSRHGESRAYLSVMICAMYLPATWLV